ncbi:hypothetical protein LguiA_035273 [Lonicera macranthoides]
MNFCNGSKAYFVPLLCGSEWSRVTFAYDNAALQDFCVADFSSSGLNLPHIHPRASESVGGYSAAWASFNSQTPGAITISKAVFGSKPSISDDILAKVFQENKTTVDMLQMKS